MSSFEQTMMGRNPRFFKPSFVEIGQPVPEMIFERFFTIYGRGGHLVMMVMMIQRLNQVA